MNKIILPFQINVICKGYHGIAFPLGVIQSHIADFDKWICNKFINFTYRSDASKYAIVENDGWSVEDGLTQRFEMTLAPSTISWNLIDFVELNKRMLAQGTYILGIYNEYYVPCKKPYQRRDFTHDYIIFGYDDEKEVFKSAGYVNSGNYEYFDLRYEDYINSINSIRTHKFWINYNSMKPNYEPVIRIDKIINELGNYLNSQKDNFTIGSKDVFGVSACDKLAEYVKCGKNNLLDLRFTRAYMEHKAVMNLRLNTLHNEKIIKNRHTLEAYSENVYSKACNAFNLSIKYNLTKRPEILETLYRYIKDINSAEKALLEKAMIEMKKYD